jgi:hypothetical protein
MEKNYGHLYSGAQILSYALRQISVNVEKVHFEPERRTLPELLGHPRCPSSLKKPILYKLLLALLITDSINKNSRKKKYIYIYST